MKKILALLLAVVMVLGMVACASKTEAPAETTTTEPAAETTTEETKTEEEKKAEEERKKKEEEERLKGKVALDEATEKRLKEMEEKIANYEAKESKEARAKEVVKAMEKHKIPAYLRDRLAKSISDDEDIEDAVSAYKQELITNGLDDEHSGGSKAASEKQIDEAADSLLESITVK